MSCFFTLRRKEEWVAKLNCCLLSGLNAGASISFDVGSYTLGHGAAPFLALDDESLEPIHLSLEVVPHQNIERGLLLFVTPHGKAFINGEEIFERKELKEDAILRFGANEMMIEPEGVTFQELYKRAQELNAYIEHARIANEAARIAKEQGKLDPDSLNKPLYESGHSKDGSANKLSAHDAGLNKVFGTDSNALDENPTYKRKPFSSLGFHRWPLISGIFFLVIGIVILTWLLYMLIFVPARTIANTRQDLLDFLRENNVAHIVIDDSKGFLKASGMVEDQEAKNKILKRLPQLDDTVVLNLTTAEAYNLDIERAFRIRGASMSTYWDADGKLRVRGYVQDSRAEVALISSVKSILPNDVQLRSDFVYEADVKPIIQKLIRGDEVLRNLNIRFIYTPLAIAYSSDQILVSNQDFIAFKQKLRESLKAPIELNDASVQALTYLNLISTITNGRANSNEIAPFDRELVYDYKVGVMNLAPYSSVLSHYDLSKGGIDLSRFDALNNGDVGTADSNDVSTTLAESRFKGSPSFVPHHDKPIDTNKKGMTSLIDNILGTDVALGVHRPANTPSPLLPKDSVRLEHLDEEIQSITFKPLKFITLKSGAKVFTGGMLPSGHIVKDIEIDHLVLQDENGEEFNYEIK